jgi:hypothetical protein
VDLVRSCGFAVSTPVNLRSTNNVVVWLSPSPVVAKIAEDRDKAAKELAVARALIELFAPVVPPINLGIEQPVSIDSRFVTFWRYEPQVEERELSAGQVAESLFDLHGKLALLRDRWTFHSIGARLKTAVHALERPDLPRELVDSDRELLHRTLTQGIARLALPNFEHVIHGSPHRLNVLEVDGAPRFIDFETVELGPLEWDLAHLEPDVADLYPGAVDREVLAFCRVLVSASTSAWCWAGADRGTDMKGHAEHHLRIVRAIDTGSID